MFSVHRFAIQTADLPDALIRVLGPFAVRQARLAAVDHALIGAAARIDLVVTGLADAEAAHLQARLLAMPFVHAVQLEARQPGGASDRGAGMHLRKEKISC
jgi:hypothetical protein